MKKILLFFCVLLILSLSLIYFFIPETLVVSNITTLPCSISAANRVLQQKNTWKTFWPGKTQLTTQNLFTDDDHLFYNNDTFAIKGILQNILYIAISNQNSKINTILLLTSLPSDTLVLNWNYTTQTSANPITRIRQYRQAVNTKKVMQDILSSIKQFLSKNENIYGFDITQTSTKDTFLISTKIITEAYPSTTQIYFLIEKLQSYAKNNGAKQTGFPMVNITQTDKSHYVLMTAIPTDKLLNGKGNILYQRLISGRFLTTTVTGGEKRIANAYLGLQQFFQDYARTSMAVPFMYLVTDRSKETDTSKWITKLYFPVM